MLTYTTRYKAYFIAIFCYLSIIGITNHSSAQTLVSKQVFNYTGSDQVITIPPCINQLKIKMWGAGGGGSNIAPHYAGAGAGGYVEGVLNVANGNTYTIMVGEGGVTDGSVDNFSYGFGGAYSSVAFGGYGGGLSGFFFWKYRCLRY